MSVAHDASTAYPPPDGADTSISFSHTCSGANRYLFVSVHHGSSDIANTITTGPAYNGVGMSLVQSSGNSPNSQFRIDVYGLIAPATGANNVTLGSSGNGNGRMVVVAASFTGVDQTTPIGTPAFGTWDGTDPSVNVSSETGGLVVDFVTLWGGSSTGTAGAGQTSNASSLNINSNGMVETSTEAGAGTVTMSWTDGAGSDNGIVAIPIKAVSAAVYQHSGTDGTKSSDTVSYLVRPPASTCRIIGALA